MAYYGSDDHHNKLSWIYKRKLKLKRAENRRKKEAINKINETATRIVVRNLPFEIKEDEVRTLYKKYGEIEKIILFGQSLPGCAFIDFKRIQDASKAIFNTNKIEFLGRTITCGWVLENSKLYQKSKNITETDNKNKPSNSSLKRKNTDKKNEQHKSLTLRESNKPKQMRKH
ncbi:PREDICTED: multiple RNA-binding domain-containing protein 1-like isoform X2 [Polistes dominula]|uniref:Multiple RNA-binding domain-containing protein 1-like isoform X2 n=1 Tax=Polistes dominula TaxID=743375 RepID=A0ABM1ICW6_POLDO|nr:PREDICTED: multiple RNA-binding domain-containing protein 1-like isoform X2 [Polistes dominula]XP_015178053.1 PREDICTED: multiple RNA-binding domain-containing protein 1-like isoform X2 [Polistes dominula]